MSRFLVDPIDVPDLPVTPWNLLRLVASLAVVLLGQGACCLGHHREALWPVDHPRYGCWRACWCGRRVFGRAY